MTQYLTPKQAAQKLAVHVSSLRRWENEGKITAIRTPGGQRRYKLQEIETISAETTIITVCYGRVSTHSQRDDLQRQIELLRQHYPDAEIISEIGSGLNFKRKKFLSILERIMSGNIQRLVVAHPDRLVRFGFELIKWLCEKHQCQLVVLNEPKISPEAELVQDMLSIIHCFSSRLYGLRKYALKAEKKLQKEHPSWSLQSEDAEEIAQQCQENQAIT